MNLEGGKNERKGIQSPKTKIVRKICDIYIYIYIDREGERDRNFGEK